MRVHALAEAFLLLAGPAAAFKTGATEEAAGPYKSGRAFHASISA